MEGILKRQWWEHLNTPVITMSAMVIFGSLCYYLGQHFVTLESFNQTESQISLHSEKMDNVVAELNKNVIEITTSQKLIGQTLVELKKTNEDHENRIRSTERALRIAPEPLPRN
jgi:hypothetical protein